MSIVALFAPLISALRIQTRLSEACKTNIDEGPEGKRVVIECPGVRISIELSREFLEVMNTVPEEYRWFFQKFYLHTALATW